MFSLSFDAVIAMTMSIRTYALPSTARTSHFRTVIGVNRRRHLDTLQKPSTHVDVPSAWSYPDQVDIEASARKHGVSDDDMLHALRHHWKAFETDDDAVTMFIGPSTSAEPLEVGVVTDDDGTAVIHAMRARPKFLKGLGKQ